MIAGVSVLGAFLASLGMFFVGFIFYGLLFSKQWQTSRGLTEEQLKGQSPVWMAGGYVIELVAAFGIGWLITRLGISGLVPVVTFGALLGLLVGLPMRSYEFVYSTYHSVAGVLVDWCHVIATFSVSALIYSFFI